MSSKLLSDVCYLDQVAPSGECLRGEGLVRLFGAAKRRLYLAAYLPLVVPGLHASTGICSTVLRLRCCDVVLRRGLSATE